MHSMKNCWIKSFCNAFGIENKKMEQILNDHIVKKYDYKWPLFTFYSLAVWNDVKA